MPGLWSSWGKKALSPPGLLPVLTRTHICVISQGLPLFSVWDVTACVCVCVCARARVYVCISLCASGQHRTMCIAGEPPAGQHHGPLHHQPVPRRPGAAQGQGHRWPGSPPRHAAGPPDRKVDVLAQREVRSRGLGREMRGGAKRPCSFPRCPSPPSAHVQLLLGAVQSFSPAQDQLLLCSNKISSPGCCEQVQFLKCEQHSWSRFTAGSGQLAPFFLS